MTPVVARASPKRRGAAFHRQARRSQRGRGARGSALQAGAHALLHLAGCLQRQPSGDRRRYDGRSDDMMGCLLQDAASRKISSALCFGAVSIATSRAPPTVNVPVLSNMTVCARARASRGPPPLIRIPSRAAWETPAINATGAARISGHGVAATSTASPRIGSPESSHAAPAMRSVSGRSSKA